MNWMVTIASLVATIVSATYALKAEWVRDQVMDWTARTYGRDSLAFRVQQRVMGNARYVASFRFVSSIVAICFLALTIYVITVDIRN